MIDLIAGVLVLFATGFAIWILLPRDGKSHPIVASFGTWIGAGLTSGIGVGGALVISSVARWLI